MPSTSESPSPASFDLADPLWAIEHLARLFRLEADSARELTYRDDFPMPIKVGRRWLWFPEEVLAWTRKQRRYSTAQRKRGAAPPATGATAPEVRPAAPEAAPSYRPRSKRTGRAA